MCVAFLRRPLRAVVAVTTPSPQARVTQQQETFPPRLTNPSIFCSNRALLLSSLRTVSRVYNSIMRSACASLCLLAACVPASGFVPAPSSRLTGTTTAASALARAQQQRAASTSVPLRMAASGGDGDSNKTPWEAFTTDMAKKFAVAATVAAVALSSPGDALAARSGGRMGGRSFSSPSSSVSAAPASGCAGWKPLTLTSFSSPHKEQGRLVDAPSSRSCLCASSMIQTQHHETSIRSSTTTFVDSHRSEILVVTYEVSSAFSERGVPRGI